MDPEFEETRTCLADVWRLPYCGARYIRIQRWQSIVPNGLSGKRLR
jgi:hypothetical protein